MPVPAPTEPHGFFSAVGSRLPGVGVTAISAVLMPDGRVLVVEDLVQAGSQLATFDPTTEALTPGPKTAALLGRPVALADGLVLMGACGATGPATLFDPVTGALRSAGSGAGPDCRATPVPLADGRVLMLSGGGAAGDTNYLYDPATATFTATGKMTFARRSYAAALLADGRVLVAGGYDVASRAPMAASAELFDPATGTFAATGSMGTARQDFTMTRLAGGGVLVAGGTNGSDIVASAEVYDPASGAFAPTGSMMVPRQFATATLLADGDVLVAGGTTTYGHDYLASAELYDPVRRSFTSTGSMTAPRAFQTATLLRDGRVLLVGGSSSSPGDVTAELYAP